MGRKKKVISIDLPKEKEILDCKLDLKEITELKQKPFCYTKAYSLGENETVEMCCDQYIRRYNHEPLEGWLFTNSQNQRNLYLKISDEEK